MVLIRNHFTKIRCEEIIKFFSFIIYNYLLVFESLQTTYSILFNFNKVSQLSTDFFLFNILKINILDQAVKIKIKKDEFI